MSPAEMLVSESVDLRAISELAASLDLREPNERAIKTMAIRLRDFYSAGSDGYFEGVVDSATGMGKSYVIAGAIDYFASQGVRNFAIITPGSTIQNKTVDQYSPGHPKSLVDLMEESPLLVHAENFDSASMAAAFEDDDQVKLFVFTIQSLIRPTSKAGRKTHEFKEGLGKAFYDHLDSLDDLIVFADEHHVYNGPKFSETLRGISPLALFGLTATPDEKMMKKTGIESIFQYPLAAAIHDRYVKTPVIVGRKDDRTDEKTQLLDGGVLLRDKDRHLELYSSATGAPRVNPIMLVSCKTIDHATEVTAFLQSDQYFKGEYAGDGVVLQVDSDQPDAALEALDKVEDSDSPVRIIVQVGMLKEGWDVKNVFVIASLRSSISEVLTEQTLGRGLRLPFGQYVEGEEFEILNQLEVISHERYMDLLKRANTLQQAFVDYETVITPDGKAETVETDTTITFSSGVPPAVEPEPGRPSSEGAEISLGYPADGNPGQAIHVEDTEDRLKRAANAAKKMKPLHPRTDFPPMEIPVIRLVAEPPRFELAAITDEQAFRELGRKLAVDPDRYLARKALEGEIDDERRIAALSAHSTATQVEASESIESPETARDEVRRSVLASSLVEGRKGAVAQIDRLLDLVLEGAGKQSEALLTSFARRLSDRLLEEIDAQRKTIMKTGGETREITESKLFVARERVSRTKTSNDHYKKFEIGTGYTGWKKSLYEQDWFDSSPEREVAVILDDADEIVQWIRLQTNDLPILWNAGNNDYNPDFLATDKDDVRWIVEVKADVRKDDEDVQAKRKAAKTWANLVNGEGSYGEWRYLLASESDIKDSKESWRALSKLAG